MTACFDWQGPFWKGETEDKQHPVQVNIFVHLHKRTYCIFVYWGNPPSRLLVSTRMTWHLQSVIRVIRHAPFSQWWANGLFVVSDSKTNKENTWTWMVGRRRCMFYGLFCEFQNVSCLVQYWISWRVLFEPRISKDPSGKGFNHSFLAGSSCLWKTSSCSAPWFLGRM